MVTLLVSYFNGLETSAFTDEDVAEKYITKHKINRLNYSEYDVTFITK